MDDRSASDAPQGASASLVPITATPSVLAASSRRPFCLVARFAESTTIDGGRSGPIGASKAGQPLRVHGVERHIGAVGVVFDVAEAPVVIHQRERHAVGVAST